uniref:Putative uridine phosphorylase n=1 Tax=Schistosoma mansoni TaxID=6183 RepID=UPI00019B379D|nr:Chain A, Putative uridine phosphorylase [Schistosoma mansoni]5CYG_B Chain B, Putative uridine phosphorylase [Schistosoma mansoni]
MATVQPIVNSHLSELDEDVFHHFGFTTKSFDFKEKFGDVKFVCVCGSSGRIHNFAISMAKLAGLALPVENIAGSHARFVLYKVDHILFADHGIGIPSTLILMHEVTKLLYYAGCKDVLFIRLGTSDGLGVKPGTIVLSDRCVNTKLEPYNELCILGKPVRRQTKVDSNAVNELKKLSENLSLKCSVVVGGTITANDFYEELGRLNGSICTFSKEEKLAFLQSVYDHGIRNMEMEGAAITSHCYLTGHRAILVCVTVVNRLETDEVTTSTDEFKLFEQLPGQLVGEYLKRNNGIIVR